MTRKLPHLEPAAIGEIIEMALSDDIAFADIKSQYGLGEDQVKTLMQQNLKPSSYKAWRKRVRAFRDRRESYK